MEKKLQFIDSARSMTSSLSNPVNILSEGIHKVKCTYGHNDKKVKIVELNISFTDVFFNAHFLKII